MPKVPDKYRIHLPPDLLEAVEAVGEDVQVVFRQVNGCVKITEGYKSDPRAYYYRGLEIICNLEIASGSMGRWKAPIADVGTYSLQLAKEQINRYFQSKDISMPEEIPLPPDAQKLCEALGWKGKVWDRFNENLIVLDIPAEEEGGLSGGLVTVHLKQRWWCPGGNSRPDYFRHDWFGVDQWGGEDGYYGTEWIQRMAADILEANRRRLADLPIQRARGWSTKSSEE